MSRHRGFLVGLLLLGALLSPAVLAQDVPAGITVTGSAVSYGAPDLASFNVGITASDADVSVAVAAANDQAAAIMEALQAGGVSESDLRTSNFSVWREDRTNEAGELLEPVFRVTNDVLVTVRDVSSLGDLLSTALTAGANQLHSVSFSMSDATALAVAARNAAMADAQARAEQLASLAGVSLGLPISITEHGAGGNGAMPMQAYASVARESVPVAAGELSVSVSVTVTYAISSGE